MAEKIEETAAAIETSPKREIVAGIYAAWRNKHLNELPVAMFARLEAAAPFLIDEISARL